jgi:hypothetical protein
MIARIWRGATAQRDAEDHVGYLRETGLKRSWQGRGASLVGRCIE